ncbi:MAG: hypothetical protein KAR42_05235 [candidate division Zixibacteria bacterium]|nr:hypothetical protein [candidate division Zixibacteria bacterium]
MSETIELLFGIHPREIYLTKDVKHPVQNELNFNIANTRSKETKKGIKFVNPDGLTPDDELPTIGSTENRLSRIFIWFPYGKDEEQDFTTEDKASKIIVSPGEFNDKWHCKRMLAADNIGVYWILFPKPGEIVLDPEKSYTFLLTNIISDAIPGMSWMNVQYNNIVDFPDDRVPLDIYKLEPVRIKSFVVKPKEVLPGETSELKWETEHATDCTISPVIGTVPVNGDLTVEPHQTSSYILTAHGPNGPDECSVIVDVKKPGWYLISDHAPWAMNLQGSFAFQLEEDKWSVINYYEDHHFDLWSTTNGVEWEQVNKKLPFSEIGWQFFSILVFDKAIWAICTFKHEVWRSKDGKEWECVTDNPHWGERQGPAVTTFKGKLWLMGGVEGGGMKSDVWSSKNGKDWQCVTSKALWPARLWSSCIEYNNKLWIVGGRKTFSDLADVWSSSDGISWHETIAPRWKAFHNPQLLVYKNQLYIIGGASGMRHSGIGNVWKMDAWENWTRLTDEIPWNDMIFMGAMVFNQLIHLAGGKLGGGQEPSPGKDGRSIWYYVPDVD